MIAESRLTLVKPLISNTYANGRHYRKVMGLYVCVCGREVIWLMSQVDKGVKKSCGCLLAVRPNPTTHGLSDHKLYNKWCGMIGRCYNPNNPKYEFYGGAGVTVCDEWMNDFKEFYDWAILNGWKDGMQVDKDIKGGMVYSPENCLIVTVKENCNNRTTTVFVTMDGETNSIMQWCEKYDINQSTFYSRMRTGWGFEESLKTPVKQINSNKEPRVFKLSYDEADEIRKLHAQGKSNIQIGKMYFVDASTISAVVNNKSWIR